MSFARGSNELENWDIVILYQGKDYLEVECELIQENGLHHPIENPLSLNFHNKHNFAVNGMVSVYDNILCQTDSITQEEYYIRKENNEVVFAAIKFQDLDKKEKTCLEKYGVYHPMKSPELLMQREATCIDRYGYPNPMQNPELQKKTQETCLSKYGVLNPSQSPEIHAKKELTSMKNNNARYPSQSPEILKKMQDTLMKRRGVTNPGQLHAIPVVAFIKLSDGIQVINRFNTILAASKFTNVFTALMHHSLNEPNVRSAGLFLTSLNNYIKKNLGSLKLPSPKYPNLYRVYWMKLDEFIEIYPDIKLPEITM